MNYFDNYITLIFIIKFIFLALAITNIYFKIKGDVKSNVSIEIKYWKERVEFVFIFLMALLIIYLFSPRANRTTMINLETKFLFYLFGFILLINAKWQEFFKESKGLIYLQKIVGRTGYN
jgi:hypothetical protein